MAFIDPDKKVEKGKKRREGIYQSSQHPEHFSNEGEEYSNVQTEDNNKIKENVNYDKIHGITPEQDKEKKDQS